MFTVKDALHHSKMEAGYQLEAIEEMDQCGQKDILNSIDIRIETIAKQMSEQDDAMKECGDTDDSIREEFYMNLRALGYLTLARQAAVTCVAKHYKTKEKEYIAKLELDNRDLQQELEEVNQIRDAAIDQLEDLQNRSNEDHSSYDLMESDRKSLTSIQKRVLGNYLNREPEVNVGEWDDTIEELTNILMRLLDHEETENAHPNPLKVGEIANELAEKIIIRNSVIPYEK